MIATIPGVWAPVVTPFAADLAPDGERFVMHCRWIAEQGAGLVAFGTTSEANSLSVTERLGLLERLLDAGVDRSRVIAGTGSCALPDAIAATAQAVELGCAGALMLPPFYYKGVSDEGLYRYYATVIDRVADPRMRLYLYHIPPVAQVAISAGLIERLLKNYPEITAGIKDSSGDWNNTRTLLDAFRGSGFRVFVGSEAFLLGSLREGGAGCITATANINARAIRRLIDDWRGAEAQALQARIDGVRETIQRYPLIAAVKQVLAHWRNDPDWARVRPPLVELDPRKTSELLQELAARGFELEGNRGPGAGGS
jgi:4-hydroxy-tetrahydrodipicolinate synthase